MKIICVSNFDKETVSDSLVCENVIRYYGEFLTKTLNDKFSGDDSPNYYNLVEDDYKLYEWKP